MKSKLPTIVVGLALTAFSTSAMALSTLSYTDNFSPPSPLWSNSIGNWTSSNGQYYAQAPNNNPETYSGLPFDFSNTNFSLTVTINSLRDEGIWLDTDGSRNNGVLLVLGGNAQTGNWAYWHIFQNGIHSAPLEVNATAFPAYADLTYTFTVLISGDTYQAYEDPDGILDSSSFLLTTLVDNTYSHGDVGLYDFYSATSFSNFSVSGDLYETPLPAALPLFASGLGAMGLFGWRRKRKATIVTA